MNALWNHFVFPVIGTAKRAFIFNLSARRNGSAGLPVCREWLNRRLADPQLLTGRMRRDGPRGTLRARGTFNEATLVGPVGAASSWAACRRCGAS